jgi:uncharacterized protein (TIGR03067 family)
MYACVVLLATALAPADAVGPPDGVAAAENGAVDDLSDLQGAWAVVAFREDGKEVPANVYAKTRWVFRGWRVEYRSNGRVNAAGVLDARPRADPPAFDAAVGGQPHKDRAIYRLQGDLLEVAFTRDGSPRPTGFASGPGSGVRLITFIRDRQ